MRGIQAESTSGLFFKAQLLLMILAWPRGYWDKDHAAAVAAAAAIGVWQKDLTNVTVYHACGSLSRTLQGAGGMAQWVMNALSVPA